MTSLRPPERRVARSGTMACGAASRLSPGFTLLEIIAVLAVLSMLAVIAMSSVDTTTSNLRTAAESLRANMRFAQIMSMKDSTALTITVTGSGYTLGGGTVACSFPSGSGSTVNLPAGVAITAGAATLSFDSRGRPSVGGATLGAAHTITLSSNGQSLNVIIQPLSGFMEVS